MLIAGVVPPDDTTGAVPVTEVTVPPGLDELIVWLGQVPVIVTLDPATKAGVAVPEPPLTTLRMPPKVIEPAVGVLGVKPVVPPLKNVTPPAVLLDAAVNRPYASTVNVADEYVPAVTAVASKPKDGLLAPLPSVTMIWPDTPVMVRFAMVVPPTTASMPVPDVLARAAGKPVSWKVGLPATPLPLVTDRPFPLVVSVTGVMVDTPVLTMMPVPSPFRLVRAPVRLICSAACMPPSARLMPAPTANWRLLFSDGSLFTVKKLCVWTGEPASAAVVVFTDQPFWTMATTSVPVIGPAGSRSRKDTWVDAILR